MLIDRIFHGRRGVGFWTFLGYGLMVPALFYWIIFRPIRQWYKKSHPQQEENFSNSIISPEFIRPSQYNPASYEDFPETSAGKDFKAAPISQAKKFLPPGYEESPFGIFPTDEKQRMGLGLANGIVFPFGYSDVENFPNGTIITIERNTNKARFTDADPIIQKIRKEFNVDFVFNLSEEKPVNLKAEGVVPEGTTAFQYISQASVEYGEKWRSYSAEQREKEEAQLRSWIDNGFSPPKTQEEEKEMQESKDLPVQQREEKDERIKQGMQRTSLFKYGAFFYHKGDWYSSLSGGLSRKIAGIRVFVSRQDQDSKQTQLCFGKARLLTKEAKKSLDNRDFKIGGTKLNPITVPKLLEFGLTDYQWIPPGDQVIEMVRHSWWNANSWWGDSFGKYGAFLYRSRTNPNLDCLLPVVMPEDAARYIRIYYKKMWAEFKARQKAPHEKGKLQKQEVVSLSVSSPRGASGSSIATHMYPLFNKDDDKTSMLQSSLIQPSLIISNGKAPSSNGSTSLHSSLSFLQQESLSSQQPPSSPDKSKPKPFAYPGAVPWQQY